MNSDMAIELAETRRAERGGWHCKRCRLVGVRLGAYTPLPNDDFIVTSVLAAIHDCFIAENYRLDGIIGPVGSPMGDYFDRINQERYYPVCFTWNLTTLRHVPDGVPSGWRDTPIHSGCIAVFGSDTVYAVEYAEVINGSSG